MHFVVKGLSIALLVLPSVVDAYELWGQEK